MLFHFANRLQSTDYRKRAVVSSSPRFASEAGQKAVSKFTPAFTLIEVLVVMTIIAVISTASLYYYQNAQEKSHDARRKADIKAIYAALILYRNDSAHQNYPGKPSAMAAPDNTQNLTQSLTPTYIKSLPMDYTTRNGCTAQCQKDYTDCTGVVYPGQDYVYCYIYTPSPSGCDNLNTYCKSFILVACLENQNDPNRDRDSGGDTPNSTCTAPVNYPYYTDASYTLTSPN